MHSSVSRKCECGVAFGIHGVIGIMNGMECMTVLDLVNCLWVNGMLYVVCGGYAVYGRRCEVLYNQLHPLCCTGKFMCVVTV